MRVVSKIKKVWKHPDGRSRVTVGIITALRKSGDIYVDQRRFSFDGSRYLAPKPPADPEWEWQRWHIDGIELVEGIPETDRPAPVVIGPAVYR